MARKAAKRCSWNITGWPDTMRSPEGEIVDVFGEPGDNSAEMHREFSPNSICRTAIPRRSRKKLRKFPKRSPTRRSPRDATAVRGVANVHDRSGRCEGFRRRALDPPAGERELRGPRTYRRRDALRASGRPDRYRGAEPGHVGLFGRPDDSDAAGAAVEPGSPRCGLTKRSCASRPCSSSTSRRRCS